ncbi:MAG: AMP-dependent synthetase, partial [Opitutales bacterium]|nr:AMP-dependent synthetase [Opitutales bacterium]
HGTVEQALFVAYDLVDSEFPMLAVAGRPDEAKGEALVLIVAEDLKIELDDVRQRLTEAGMPNLWIPKVIKPVAIIPTLVTGKLDLKAIQLLALE